MTLIPTNDWLLVVYGEEDKVIYTDEFQNCQEWEAENLADITVAGLSDVTDWTLGRCYKVQEEA